MKVDGKHMRTIWVEADGWSVGIIDQTKLPHRFATLRSRRSSDAAHAIKSMQVRGAPLIGAAAAYGMALALREDASDAALERAYATLLATRPTAINLQMGAGRDDGARCATARATSASRPPTGAPREICDEDVAINQAIGRNGLTLIEAIAARKKAGRARQRAHPLQCRLARDRRLGHRDGADLHGARRRRRRSMCGSTRRGRATRARRSPRGSSASTACRTR